MERKDGWVEKPGPEKRVRLGVGGFEKGGKILLTSAPTIPRFVAHNTSYEPERYAAELFRRSSGMNGRPLTRRGSIQPRVPCQAWGL